jgi:hypothetical protein
MVREGENVPFSDPANQLNPAEVHHLDQQLLEGKRDLSGLDQKELHTRLLETIRTNGTRRTLSQFHVHNLLWAYFMEEFDQSRSDSQPVGWEILPEQDPGLPPRLIQFGVGITLQTNTKTKDPRPFQEIAEPLLEIKNCYSHRRKSNTKLESPKSNPYFGMVWRELTTLRHADSRQMIEKGYRAYKPWEKEMERILGFSIEDAVYYTQKIGEGMTARLEGVENEIAKWTPSLLNFSEEAIERADEKMWVPKSVLHEWCDDGPRFHNLLTRLSVTPGTVNNFQSPLDINPLEKTPFIQIKDEYMLPLPRTLMYAIANTFYYDFISSDFNGEFQLQLGDWLENWSRDCLSKIFADSEIISNYTYEHEGERVEGDILVLHENQAIVIECKAKKLTAETRKGNFGGMDKIKRDVRNGIGRAYQQADRLVSELKSRDIIEINEADGTTVRLNESDIDEFVRWVILGESYGGIATRDFAKILDIRPTPYVCDIFDLQVLTEILTNPAQLLHYINQRTYQTEVQIQRIGDNYPNTDIYSSDEVDYLNVYNRNNGQFPPGVRRITGAGDELRRETIERLEHEGEFQYIP